MAVKPTSQDYEMLGVCEWSNMETVDRKYSEIFELSTNNVEALEELYIVYSKIVEYLYAVENRDGKDDSPHDSDDGTIIEVETDDKITYQHATKEFTCEVCKKSFSTKQKLKEHSLRRFKCKPKDNDSVMDKLVCICGSKFTKSSSLYRHKAKCSTCIKSKRTMMALEDTNFVLRSFKNEKATYNRDTFMNCIRELNTSTNRFEIEYFNKTKAWYGYKEIMKGMIKKTFLLAPENYTFYIPNMSKDIVYVHRNGHKEKITKEKLAEHIVAFCVNEFEDLVRATQCPSDDTEQFLQYHPVHYLNNKMMYEEDDILVQSLKKQFQQHIMMVFKEYKDDIKRIWEKKGLL
jgi:hypothetical protein